MSQHAEKEQNVQSGVRVAVLGTGALGTAVATALMQHGYSVRVWNRSPAATTPLAQQGAVSASTAAEAMAGSDLVLVCLTDFTAVREVLASISADEVTGPTTVVTLTTGTPDDALRARDELRARGIDYVDAGVQTAPDDIGTERATFLYAGSESAFRTYRPALEKLGLPTWLGEDVTAAATWDLALFGLWYDAQLGLLRAFDMLPDTAEARRSFAAAASLQLGHVVEATAATAAELTERDYPRGPASVDEHLVVLRQLRETRARSRFGDGGLAAPQQLVEALQRAGHGELGLTALADPTLTHRTTQEA
jgi:hypothetical protein